MYFISVAEFPSCNNKPNHEKICLDGLPQDSTCTKETNEYDKETLQA